VQVGGSDNGKATYVISTIFENTLENLPGDCIRHCGKLEFPDYPRAVRSAIVASAMIPTTARNTDTRSAGVV